MRYKCMVVDDEPIEVEIPIGVQFKEKFLEWNKTTETRKIPGEATNLPTSMGII